MGWMDGCFSKASPKHPSAVAQAHSVRCSWGCSLVDWLWRSAVSAAQLSEEAKSRTWEMAMEVEMETMLGVGGGR
jgi:hypothetical protein